MLKYELLVNLPAYIERSDFKRELGVQGQLTLQFLAQGEYNINFVIEGQAVPKQDRSLRFVIRVNTGSQIKSTNQIAYEYQALALLSATGVTPKPYYLDDSRLCIPYGLLVMEYLPGEPLDYRRDLTKAAETFAHIHRLKPEKTATDFLIRDSNPFSAIVSESEDLLTHYFNCPDADPIIRQLLEKILLEARERKNGEIYLRQEPWLAVINTEVNSHNFIVNRECQTCHLIDWEKPIWGEPAQDLSMFVIATTTLWKRNYRLSRDEETLFINAYKKTLIKDGYDKHVNTSYLPTLSDRIEMFKFFNYLRAISWCAMAWTEYIKPGRPLVNTDTFAKIKTYLEPAFLVECFPFVKN
ncbi:aminoglycoside phosphotransferase family protein [Dehalobacter sp. DCM]|uniref:phosphotransferase family protein n=1 Tax=Dehalobacter sp. DCM TaxID=2907827 RepID=UPI0030816759|nr:aminoglycoside phosphotransferase family protein [Dehalobacter sp. DCM]